MAKGSTSHPVTSDAGAFAMVPLRIVQRLNETSSAHAGLSVLIALHKWSDREVYAYPSHASIAKVAGISVNSVKRGIKALEEIGALTVVPRWLDADGRATTQKPSGEKVEQTSNGYQIHYAMNGPTPAQSQTHPPAQSEAHPPAQEWATNQTQCEPNPVRTNSQVAEIVYEAEIVPSWETSFEQWWKMQPRKVAKDKARKLWQKMTDSERDLAIEVMPYHVEHWRASKTEAKFIPHPPTWLNQRRWEDELVSDYKPQGSLVEQISRYALDQRRQDSNEHSGHDDSPRGLGSGDDRLE